MTKIITVNAENAEMLVIKCDNSDQEITISRDNMQIQALEVYNMLNYSSGDKYELRKKGDSFNKDALEQLYQLLDEIITELNELPSVNDEVTNDLAQIALTNEESSLENNEE